ncbi:MAG: hypothetical protein AAF493_01240 [Pseudomonadota bacterium]
MDILTSELEPEWDVPLRITLTPGAIIETMFATADTVHTGTESCIDPDLIIIDITAADDHNDNYCRYVEQRYVEDERPDITWQDWTIELKLDGIYILAHWRAQVTGSPADWDWCAAEAEKAFTFAAMLVGKRVRRGIVVEHPTYGTRAPRVQH